MFRSGDFERVLLALLVAMILAGAGFILWQRSVADELRSSFGTAERQLTEIGELAEEIIRLQEEMRGDALASERTGPLPYIEEQMTRSRIGRKFAIAPPLTEAHESDGFEDTRFVLTPAQADYDFSRQDIANFLLHIEGNTTRMKATRIKLDLSTRKGAGPDTWKPQFTITDRKPIAEP
jgi:hypothetical protein